MKKTSTPKIKPRGKQILVQPDPEVSRQGDFGLVLPSSVEQEQKAVGTVIAVGPDIKDVKKGDRVIYAAFGGESIGFSRDPKKVDYKLLFDEDVLAFIED